MADWTNDYLLNDKPRAGDWTQDYLVKPPAAQTKPETKEDSLGPWGAGWRNLESDYKTGWAALTGNEELLAKTQKEREETARRYQPKIPSYTDIPGEGVFDTLGRFGQYAYEQGAQSLPYMGASALGAVAGIAASPAAVPAALAGAAGATVAGLPAFFGQNVQEQLEGGKKLKDVNLPAAGAAAVGQSALDSIGELFPFLSPAAKGSLILRMAKKGVASGAVEGLTESAQQAIQIGQADPSKLWEFGPEVQKELAESAVAGGILGTGFGAVGGIRKEKAKTQPSPQEEEPAIPPPTERPPVDEMADFERRIIAARQAEGYANLARDRQSPDLLANATGLPQEAQSFKPDESVMFPAPPNTGQKVFEDVQQKLLAAGVKPLVANALARLARARYETRGKQLGVDAFTAYRQSNIDIQAPGRNVKGTYNQDEPQPRAMHYSELDRAIDKIPMKQGTGQQWLNALQKVGVKPDELEWRGANDFFLSNKDKKITADQIKSDFLDPGPPFGIAVYETQPHVQGKSAHYGEWTMGSYGQDPNSNYREVVLSAENMPAKTFKSSHFGMVPNAIAHYRSTDRTSVDGSPVRLIEEIQSDWHQQGRARGYRGSTEDMVKAFEKVRDIEAKIVSLRNLPQSEERWNQINQYLDDLEVAAEELRRHQQGAPNAPFKETWPNLTLRQAIMDAINDGKEYVAWPTGEQMMGTQGHSSDKHLKGHQAFYDKRLVDYANKLGKPYGAKVEKITIGKDTSGSSRVSELENRLRELENNPDISSDPELQGQYLAVQQMLKDAGPKKSAEVHAMKITPAMKELVGIHGFPLFQRKQGGPQPTPQGNITILPDRMIIRLFKTANESTALHEFGHAFLEEMVRDSAFNKIVANDLATVRKFVGNTGGQFTRAQHEKFARGLEQYVREGKAPTKALADVFKQFMDWLKKIYARAEQLNVELTPEMRRVFDNLFNQHDQHLEGMKAAPAPNKIGYIKETGPRYYNDRTEGPAQPGPADTYSQNPEREENFRKWFGDSVVKDENGNPLVVYHGTSKDADFGKFKVGRHGAWFTNDPAEASQYAVENDSMGHKYNHSTMRYDRTNTASRVFPVYLRIETPYSPTQADLDMLRQRAGDSPTGYKRAQSEFFDTLRAKGHDGVDFGNGIWVVLKDPNQIKSTLNKGTFSNASPLVLNQDPVEQSPTENKGSVWNAVQRSVRGFFDPLSEVPNERGYRIARNLMIGSTAAAEKKAADAKALFDGLSLQEKDAVNTYFETANADPMVIPEKIRQQVVSLKNYINGPLKQELVNKGLLSEETLNRNVDSYLPRLYLKQLMESKGIKGGARLNKAYAKKREAQSPEALVAMGEVKDPGVRAYYAMFRTQRDLGVLDFLNKVASNGDWTIPESLVEWNGKKVTPHWLKAEADHIQEVRAQGEPDPARKQAMLEQAQQMRNAATAGLRAQEQADYNVKDYAVLPDTPDFGPLRGMIVRRQIAEDIKGTNNFVDPENSWDKWFGDKNSVLTKGVSLWKTLKVPLNIPSQFRNVVSNMILLNLSGIRIDQVVPRLVEAANDMRKDGPYYQIAKKYGIGKGTMSEQELYALSEELNKLPSTAGMAGWRAVANATLKWPKKMIDFYGKMEEWGKVAKIIDEMKKGRSEEDAVLAANKALFDYSEAHTFVKRARQSPFGLPFLTFQYKMLPLVYETLRTRPTALLPYVAMAYAVPAFVAASNDIDQDDMEKLRQSLPQALRRKNDMYLLPWKDAAGRWQFVDVGYFMPWQMPYDLVRETYKGAKNMATGDTQEAWSNLGNAFQATGLFSNPVINITSAITTGVDPFTGRNIADKRDPAGKQVMDVVGYAWSLVVPSLFSGYGAAGQLWSRETGTGVNRHGEAPTTYGQIAARALGTNVFPVMPEAQRARNIQQMQHDIQDVKGRMTSSLKDQSLTPEQRRRVMENFREEILFRTKALQKYIQESAMSERLRRAS